ncbi:hypothetical protein PF005_g20835 [Phytophthora fragariae]|uniref:Uncharacterized protein n=1 Tax=Phytophthora fragariae TaxID=53985 RepID=A0A6A3SVU8_9STRA|nr:hypothetical protein PF003_g12220 [Phytophthora fragariae]KAE8927963.1 hypothetical protein PF009_g21877 [Phytophthora fragariae]KAE8987655.1 hypothetical protein PF011_g19493 [Phytophthora fragariae]KAE9089415.1 hypothetical protein PF007_g19609 [Phytophthora fragariae]KAE9089626.1 hypothetical protein PF010_g18914 [Phytophthora fragariae]
MSKFSCAAFLLYPAARQLAAEKMEISRLLCSSPESQSEDAPSLPEPAQTPPPQAAALSFVPDSQRKRPYRMSATQQKRRHEHEVYESRVYNLTLDINELRQQIQQLLELRDVHLSRLLLNGQRFDGDVLKLAWKLLDSLRGGVFGLSPSARSMFSSRTHVTQQDPAASGEIHQFVMRRGRPTFGSTIFTIKSIRVLRTTDDTERVSGISDGCVVEVLASPTGRITRGTIVALLPQILSNEALVSRIIGQRITFSSRLLLYFNSERRLVQQVAQADIMAAFKTLDIGDGNDFAALSAAMD